MKTTSLQNDTSTAIGTEKKIGRLYWTFTILFAVFMFMSAVPDLLVMQIAVNGFKEMGLPAALVPFLGVAKILGVFAILIPGYPRIREWAYAGLMFDLIGAMYFIISVGKSPENWLPIFLPITLGMLSYHFYYRRINQVQNAGTPDLSFKTA